MAKNKKMTQSILVTGGSGYLGGRIVAKLNEQASKYKIFVGTHKKKVHQSNYPSRCKFVSLELLSKKNLNAACRGMQAIIHLAALDEKESLSDPEKAMEINSLGTLRLLQAAKKARVKRFIYFSTAHVYGSPLSGKISEKSIPHPIHPYAISHRAAEDFVLAAHGRKDFIGIVLRLSNAYGAPAQPQIKQWGLLVNDLCRQAVLNRKIKLRSSGLQFRDFIALEDVTEAVGHFLRLPGKRCGDGLFNLGGENPRRIIEMAKLIAKLCDQYLGFEPKILRPMSKKDKHSNPSLDYCIGKLKSTGFRLKGDMNAEIKNTLKLCTQIPIREMKSYP